MYIYIVEDFLEKLSIRDADVRDEQVDSRHYIYIYIYVRHVLTYYYIKKEIVY